MNFKINNIFKSKSEEEIKEKFNLKWAKILIFLRKLD